MFIYLNKKIAIPNGVKLRTCQWNAEEGFIAVGGESGLLKVLKLVSSGTGRERGIAGSSNLTMNQTLEGHSNSVICAAWNEVHKKLTTSDETGLIIVWMLHKGMWFEEMINNRNKSVVRDMKWCADGQKICICYEDGAVIVGSVDGNRLWGKEFKMQLQFCEWSPDAKKILFVTPQGEVHIYDQVGNPIARVPLFSDDSTARIAGIHWYNCVEGLVDPSAPTLAIGFDTGRVQLMTSEVDEKPILIDTGMRPTAGQSLYKLPLQWNSDGSVLAVAGLMRGADGREVAQVQFYGAFGTHLRTLQVPGNGISAVAWEGGSLRIALAVDAFIYFANIRPDHKWAYFGNTLVYAFTKPERAEHCVVFFDKQSGNKLVKYVKKLLMIRACGEYCVLATKTGEANVWVLILCNAIGAPVDSKYINIEPVYMTMTETHVVCASDDVVFVWYYSTKTARLTSIETAKESGLRKKDAKEAVWFIDDNPNVSTSGFEGFTKGNRVAEDPVSCIACSSAMMIVGRESGTVMRYSLPHIQLEAKYVLRCCPQMLAINCDSTRFSVIDINGIMTFFDMDAGKGKAANELGLPPGEHLTYERKDAWDMRWADDNPELMAMMEKSRMYILRGLQPEEPVLSSGYLCRFKDLTITAVLLDDVMARPDEPDLELMIELETKSLRDTRDILAQVGLADASSFVEDNSHPRLWRLLAESALDKLDLQTAERAFVKCADYQGVQLVKRLAQYSDKSKQRAEVAVYNKRFDEAEKIYKDIDRLDLAIEMRSRLGDWFKVMKMTKEGAGDDQMINQAWVNIGDYYHDRQLWGKAKHYFNLAKANEKQVECLYSLEDYDGLAALVKDPEQQLPEGSSLLITVGEKLASVGLAEDAVEAYLRAGDVKGAIDCCVLLNQWDKAVMLAEEHQFPQIEGLLVKYAQTLLTNDKKMEAVELYRKANRHPDAAKLLAEIAQDVVKSRAHPHRALRLYVLAALEVEKFRSKTLRSAQGGGTTMSTLAPKGTMAAKATAARGGGATVRNTQATMATLDGLMQGDAISSENKMLDQAWRGVEAMHLYIETHKLLYSRKVDAAMKCAEAMGDYTDILDPRDVHSLLAIAAFHNQMYAKCSQAFMRLEQLESLSPDRREAFQDLAFKVFTQFKPDDFTIPEEQKRRDAITPEYLKDLRKHYMALCAPS
mmetsp:Transcript_68370/g.163192  ORF Transcript_68370/g.163192 Transcript_68370/m.163192 type:complete len:1174 (+) Transcript_68370:203-3724(+)